ncbi:MULTISPECIES: NAD(P)-dependent alcohol dehydrogenase [Arthrobacter]|uniref:alcohol dehydrogenase n=1 Tax=Arthrobacter caoxuetaonis TaxID=2886935 RepID=A0A9X1SBC9_9MICC|nr:MULTISPECIES: NAD(P)-dependent alcohol dehydrogenase [Arthrobacter]MCC3281529.1 NAD(P)-dependent alcohol dehydrogenase [Arthrobacter caoxuetaonis]MCC3296217.1 NAD(P)-dependent alcohol dehydrogenase [Arthrobacter caoxuetaonis]MCC9192295.1 NAD(P)-dependent alcohol dehydrogenase [Arthrobacter sp. zg-Y916]USQ56927.1 NAD(P)-dependent alcohol dehydrogenase [Arthrobacter caoxuetaonis]
MKALQYRSIGSAPEIVEIDTPEPGPGQIRLKVTAAGVCHSDEYIMSLPEDQYIYGLPLTLGHEGAGTVDMIGEGVKHIEEGQSMAIYGPWGCGLCYECSSGRENYCRNAAKYGIAPPGLGAPGAMAEYIIVDSARHLVPLGDLDPVQNVSLTDAGLTPYHAIKGSLEKLPSGSTAVVIGVGGLGHVAIQILRSLTAATVVALDIDPAKLDLATSVGAQYAFPSEHGTVDIIKDLTRGLGVDAVFDFVTNQATLDMGQAMVRSQGDQVLVGVGSGTLKVGLTATASWETSIRAPYWGSRTELFEVLDLARDEGLNVHTEVFSLEDAPAAYEKLKSNQLVGRAVVVP